MKEPYWLESEAIRVLHLQLVGRFGGESGIPNTAKLESALARPMQAYHYGEPSLFPLAALYADGIVNNHPFLDGNKRTGLIAAALFLEMNGKQFRAPEAEAVLFTLGLAKGEMPAAEYARWLEAGCAPSSQ